MRFKADRRFIEIMFGLGLVLAGMSSGDTVATIVLFILGLYLLSRQFNRGDAADKKRKPVYFEEGLDDDEEVEPQPRTEQVYAHALDAVKRAGRDPSETTVLPIDVGVMVYSGDAAPVIYRTRPVLDDIDYVQPYVQLRLPTRAKGRIRFEIADSDGQVLFIHEEDKAFEKWRNLVVPAARLRIHDGHGMQGEWGLRVSADGVLIADHHFGWQESTTKVIRRHLTEDGELSGEIRAMVADSKLEKMSLDELLEAQQPEQDSKAQGRR